MEKKQELKRNLGISTAMATVVGCVIGSGVFFKPQAIYTATGGAPGLGMLAWLITGLVCIAAAMTFAEVAIMIPRTGGMVAYLEEAFGKKVGFLAGWMQSILFYPAMIAALAVIFAEQATLFVGESFRLPIAIGAIILIIILNNLGSAVGGGVQIIFTICKLIPLILLMIFGFLRGSGANPIFTPMVSDGLNPGVVLGQLMVAVLFAFEGWTNVGAIAGEMKNPGKDLPVAIIGGVSAIMAVYFAINLAYLWVLPANELMNLPAPASAVAIAIFGDIGGKIISVGIMISVLGATNGFVLAGSRVAYSLAEEGTLPFSSQLAKLNKAQVPTNSIILVGGLGCLFAISGQFNRLTDLAVFACWIFYTLTFFAVIRLRKIWPDFVRTYKVPLYPVIPAIAIISGIYVVLNQLFMSGSTTRILAIGSIILTLIGLPIYNATTKKKTQ
ncbi:APC family permease [Anaerotignum sp.]|uniref:APC family permease n=1 Tax=Anaerotignum sp. TaxID=2039241 RepID=UPI00271480B2|nr:amino acid permease [Anaerotignum sp.]